MRWLAAIRECLGAPGWLGAVLVALIVGMGAVSAVGAAGARAGSGRTKVVVPVAPSLDRKLGPLAWNAAGPYADDHVLVGFKPGTSASSQRSIENAAGAIRARKLGTGDLLSVPHGDVQRVIERLKRDPAVRYAEPDYVMQASGVPDDPQFALQWGLQNTGQVVNGTAGTAGDDETWCRPGG